MGFMGQNRGSFFGTPEWVELEKKPGHTSIGKVYPDGSTFKTSLNWFLGWANPWNFFVMSPNFVWFLVAFTDYALCPYDLDKARVFTADWVLYRCAINTFIMLTYFGFWSLTLYSLGFGTRKFNPDHVTGAGRMFHNLWYCILGSVQLGLWEALFMHCYSTGKLEYISNEEAFATPGNIARVVFWTLAVPLYRSIHFYFAHRFIHIRALYKYVHSLHHRNTDIEPFSGLCMHPIEHLYYYSCVGPSLYFKMSPFHAMWNLIHLLISPAASHSGWENCMQSDQFHYLHHRKFECNYGTAGEPLDRWFGTYRGSLNPKDKSYKGGASDKELDKEFTANNGDAGVVKGSAVGQEYKPVKLGVCGGEGLFGKGGLSLKSAVPSFQDGIYHLHYCVTFTIFAMAVCGDPYDLGILKPTLSLGSLGTVSNAQLLSAMIAYGPIAFGAMMLGIFGDRYAWSWPFHKDKVIGSFGFHVLVGFGMTAVPTYHLGMAVFGFAPPMLF